MKMIVIKFKSINFRHLCTIFFVVALCSISLAYSKTMDNPGEGGGVGNEIGPNSSVVLSGGGLINTFTGMPFYSIKPLRMVSNTGYNLDVDFYYSSNARFEATQDNAVAPTGWCGAGWHMGFSYIYSVDDDTATLGDDRYYYVYANGIVSEIVKTADGKYRIKNDPFWSVETTSVPYHAGFTLTNLDSWKVTKPDGSFFVFGTSDTAAKASCLGIWPRYDTAGLLIPVESPKVDNPSVKIIYYAYPQNKRWNIIYGEDISGSRISFKYEQMLDSIIAYSRRGDSLIDTNTLRYIRESHVKEAWVEDNGDHFIFTTSGKSTNERTSSLSTHYPNYYETRYLRSIRWLDKNNTLLDSISLAYSGDAGQLSHLYSGTAGYEKRLLMGITSHKSVGMVNRVFEYDRNPSTLGLLTRISEPTPGKSTVFTYGMQSIYQTEGGSQNEYLFPVVTKVETFDGLHAAPAMVTTYTYPTEATQQKYIPLTGLGFWGIVKANSGSGDVITSYEINPDNHLFGTPLNVTMQNTAGKLVSSQTNETYSYPFITEDSDTFYYTMLVNNESTVDGVVAKSGTPACALDTLNGRSTMVYKTNSDGKSLVTKADFAYQHYSSAMGASGSHQLSQVAATTMYEVPEYVGSCDLLVDSAGLPRVYMPVKCVSATFTTWAPGTGTSVFYRPAKTYAWKSNIPLPSRDFQAFNPSNSTANGWVLTGSIEKYNKCGSVLQTLSPTGTYSATIYRSDYNLPLAKIANARYDECAFYTCDYDVNDAAHSGYFDYVNGWEKAGAVLRSDTTHFGENAVYVNNDFGPGRNIRIYQGKNYTMSAWVYVVSGTLVMSGDYRHLLADTTPHPASGYQKSFGVSQTTATATGAWQRIELRIPASTDLTQSDWTGHDWCARVFVGSPNGVKAFIDDIRFYPSDALVSTVYYNMKWRSPRLEVDANHVPGKLVELDSVGRLSATYKIDKTKRAQQSGFKTITMKKDYRLMGDDIRVLSPGGGEHIRAGSQYAISWWPGVGKVGTGGVDISFFDGSSWSAVGTVTGQNAYTWSVPAGAKSGCKVKVVAHDDSTNVDQSDTAFTIFVNSAPSTPVLVAPINGNELLNDTVQLSWNASSDPESNPVTYKVELRRNRTSWETIADNYGSTQKETVLPGYGPYEWRITASDGSLTSSSTGKFYYVPADFFILRDIYGRWVYSVPNDLYSAIYGTLSTAKKPKFENTYRNTTSVSDYHVIADAAYFSSELSPEFPSHALTNFYYSIYHTNDYKWLDGAWEGDGVGYTGQSGGTFCGGEETRGISIKRNCENGLPCGSAPAMELEWEWGCPGDGRDKITWDGQYKTPENAIMRFKWSTTATGYHTWYRAHHRNEGTLGWKHDGEWTNDDDDHKVDKIWLRMFKYDAN